MGWHVFLFGIIMICWSINSYRIESLNRKMARQEKRTFNLSARVGNLDGILK